MSEVARHNWWDGVINSSSSSCWNSCYSGHMAGLACTLYKIMYVFPPWELQCVSGPLKMSSSRCSMGLIYQTLEATSRQTQLLPTSSLGNFDTFASRKPASGFSRRLLHHGASDEFVTSGLRTSKGQFQASEELDSSVCSIRRSWSYDLIDASRSMTEVRSLPPLWCSVRLGIRCVPLPPLVWICLYFPMLRFISCAAEQRQVVRITNPATCL